MYCNGLTMFHLPGRYRRFRNRCTVANNRECIRKILVFRQSPGHEWRTACLDHLGRTAGIHLITVELLMILQNGIMHQAGSALPVMLRIWLGQYRYEFEIVMFLLPLFRQIRIQADRRSGAPVQHHGTVQPDMKGMLHHALDGAETTTPRHENNGFFAFLMQEEIAEWTFYPQHITHFHPVEHVTGKFSALHQTNMQLQTVRFMRGIGEG